MIALAVLAGVVTIPRHALAQDPGSDLDDTQRLEGLFERLNNPTLQRYPEEIRRIVSSILATGAPRAFDELRGRLLDTRERSVIVEQIMISVLSDPDARELVDEVIERLRIESGSALSGGCFCGRMDSVEPLGG